MGEARSRQGNSSGTASQTDDDSLRPDVIEQGHGLAMREWWLGDLLAPRTDTVVAGQGIALLIVFSMMWLPAHRWDVMPLWWGLLLLSLGLFGLRAVH